MINNSVQYHKLLDVSIKTGLPLKKILDLLFLLKDGNPFYNNELIQKLGVSRNVINQVKKELQDMLEPVSLNTQLKPGFIDIVSDLFEPTYKTEEKLLNLNPGLDQNDKTFERLEPLRKYDQFTATQETVAKRVTLMNFLDDIKGKRILFLGDDDFTSLEASKVKEAAEIAVTDIDGRILETIQKISGENKLSIKTIVHDLKQKLPTDLINKFDVIFTDPPYTIEGVTLFLSRSIEALDRNNLASRIYLCYGNSDRAKERFLPIYQAIIDSGLMIRYVFDKFNRYTGAESIGNSSSLYILDATPKTRLLVKGNYDKPIYTTD